MHLKINFVILARSAVADAVAEVEEKEERAYTMQTDHNIYLRFRFDFYKWI